VDKELERLLEGSGSSSMESILRILFFVHPSIKCWLSSNYGRLDFRIFGKLNSKIGKLVFWDKILKVMEGWGDIRLGLRKMFWKLFQGL